MGVIHNGAYCSYSWDEKTLMGAKELRGESAHHAIDEYRQHVRAYEWLGRRTAKPYFLEFAGDDNLISIIHMEHIPASTYSESGRDCELLEEVEYYLVDAGIRHDDLHSNNVLVNDEGWWWVIDWGQTWFEGDEEAEDLDMAAWGLTPAVTT